MKLSKPGQHPEYASYLEQIDDESCNVCELNFPWNKQLVTEQRSIWMVPCTTRYDGGIYFVKSAENWTSSSNFVSTEHVHVSTQESSPMKMTHDRKKGGISAIRSAFPSKRTASSQSKSISIGQSTYGTSIDNEMQSASHGNVHACQNENVP